MYLDICLRRCIAISRLIAGYSPAAPFALFPIQIASIVTIDPSWAFSLIDRELNPDSMDPIASPNWKFTRRDGYHALRTYTTVYFLGKCTSLARARVVSSADVLRGFLNVRNVLS